MKTWQRKWMEQHPHASLQEFAVALSERMTRNYILLLCLQVVTFIVVLVVASFFR